MPMNILITGGAGFIGSHTILELLNVGHTVIAVDNGCNAFIETKNALPEALKRVQDITGKQLIFYNVDIRDKSALDEVFKKVSLYWIIVEVILRGWKRWRCWQVGSGGSEAIFVSGVVEFDQLAVGQVIPIAAALD